MLELSNNWQSNPASGKTPHHASKASLYGISPDSSSNAQKFKYLALALLALLIGVGIFIALLATRAITPFDASSSPNAGIPPSSPAVSGSVQSSPSPPTPASYAFDSDFSTSFSSSAPDSWVGLQLSTSTYLETIGLYPAAGAESALLGLQIHASSAPCTWSTFASLLIVYSAVPSTWNYYTIPPSMRGQFDCVRVFGPSGLRLSELRVFGSRNGPVVSSTGRSRPKFNFSTGSGGGLDGLAELPGQRLTDFKAWANPIPNWSSIPASRRVNITANSQAAFQSAFDAAAAMTGGDRLLVVPTGFSASMYIYVPLNADPNYDVIVAWERIVDGSFSIARNTRIPLYGSVGGYSGPPGMPLLRTATVGAGAQYPVFMFSNGRTRTRFKFYGLEIRVNTGLSDNNGNQYCAGLVDYGPMDGRPADPLDAPSYTAFSHCIFGGRAFTDGSPSTRRWRPFNLGRTVYDGGRGMALIDSHDVEHGAAGSLGSDRGIWNGIYSQGPVWIHNIQSDKGGGILFMHGGGDTPDSYPNMFDFELSYSYLEWKREYAIAGPGRLMDSAGARCPWTSKNQFEVKTGFRIWAHHNVFWGFWPDAQSAPVVLKAVNQDSNGQTYASGDIVFADNYIVSGSFGLGFSVLEGYNGGEVAGVQRMTIARNFVYYGLGSRFHSPITSRLDALIISFRAGNIIPYAPSCNFTFEDNYFEFAQTDGYGFNFLFASLAKDPLYTGEFVFRRNVFAEYPGYSINADASMAVGMNQVFSEAWSWTNTTRITVQDNVFVNPSGMPSSDSNFASVTRYFPSRFDLGVVDGSSFSERMYNQTNGSFLSSGGQGGRRIGPDFSMINTMKDAVIAGSGS